MRWLSVGFGFVVVSALGACATSQGVGGGGAGGFGAVDGGGATGGFGATGGVATGGTSATGGSGATGGGGSGGMAGTATGGVGGIGGGTGATGGVGATGGGGATGGTGGSNCDLPVPNAPCDEFPQCGCANGLACMVQNTSGMTYCGLAGSVTPYNACTNLNDCQQGYGCVGGACKAYCATDSDCTQTQGQCFQVNDSTTNSPIPGMMTCSKKCAPENPSAACGSGLGCYVYNSSAPFTTDCATAGTGTGTGACSADPTACAPGYVCLTTGDCKKWCRIGLSDCGGSSCIPFQTPLYLDGVQYGACP